MKIGIITHHDVHNHGAQLQLLALKRVLAVGGHDVVILSYVKNYDFVDRGANTKYNVSLRSIPYYLGYLFREGPVKTIFNINKRRLLREFRRDHGLIEHFYASVTDLDCVVVGSDEVFSIETGLNTFFWGMGVPCADICAYAASFGPSTLEAIESRFASEFIQAGIRRMKHISVRDDNSRRIISQLGGLDVPIVSDPVILHGYPDEVAVASRATTRPYLLVYSYDKNLNEQAESGPIRAYARSRHLKVVSAGFYHRWCDRNVNVGPVDLLQWFKGAEAVVTDTFHGTVLSIVTNRPFVAKLRGNSNKLGFLIGEYGLNSRLTSDFTDVQEILDKNIDYAVVNAMLKKNREESMKHARACIPSDGSWA